MRIIDINTWKRKEHFEFFTKMDSPFLGITTEVDCTTAFHTAQENGHSFFATYLHKSMIAVNAIEELRFRIVDEQVILFDIIHAGSTVARKDGTFAFIFVPFSNDFAKFNSDLQKEIKAVEDSQGLRLNNDDLKTNLIRHSTFPWYSFTSLLHPTSFKKKDTIPKITFGKFSIKNNKKMLPVSIEAHHGLVDGLHVANYLENFQHQLNSF